MPNPTLLRPGPDLAIPCKMLIGGQWLESAQSEWIQSHDPVTGKVIGRCPNASLPDLAGAIQAAQSAQRLWQNLSPADRARRIRQFAERLAGNADELAHRISFEHGKPLAEAKQELRLACEFLETRAPNGAAEAGVPLRNFFRLHCPRPAGLAGCITSSAQPLLGPVAQGFAAISNGNAVILKPAEQTSLAALRLAELIAESEFPPGLWNAITGAGKKIGSAIAAHPGVRAISFSGLSATAQSVLSQTAAHWKKVSLHLSTKSAAIVCADADLAPALEGVFAGAFAGQGESDSAVAKVYVAHSIFEKFISELIPMMQSARLGSGLDPSTQIGPLVSLDQQMRVLGSLDNAAESGAHILCGGKAPAGDLAQGYFVQPTLWFQKQEADLAVHEEIFGPVLEAIPFRSPDEIFEVEKNFPNRRVVEIWTGNCRQAEALSQPLGAASIFINSRCPAEWRHPLAPAIELTGSLTGQTRSIFIPAQAASGSLSSA